MALISAIAKTSSSRGVRGRSILVEKSALLKQCFGRNISVTTFYIHFINSRTIPADGSVVHHINPLKVDGGKDFSLVLNCDGVKFNTGLCVYASSTEYDKTIIHGDDLICTLSYDMNK
jgi:hypothetical protein